MYVAQRDFDENLLNHSSVAYLVLSTAVTNAVRVDSLYLRALSHAYLQVRFLKNIAKMRTCCMNDFVLFGLNLSVLTKYLFIICCMVSL